MNVKIRGTLIYASDQTGEPYFFFEPSEKTLKREYVKEFLLPENHVLLSVKGHTKEIVLELEDVKQVLKKYEKED